MASPPTASTSKSLVGLEGDDADRRERSQSSPPVEVVVPTPNDAQVRALLDTLRGQEVWFVNSGGAAGSSFSLSLGKRVPRDTPLQNPSVTDDFRQNEGELALYVWCTWRLESGDSIASSDQDSEEAEPLLKALVGKTVKSVEVRGRCFDLHLTIGDANLDIFCDGVPPEPSFDSNWELIVRQSTALVVGPGFASDLSFLSAQPGT